MVSSRTVTGAVAALLALALTVSAWAAAPSKELTPRLMKADQLIGTTVENPSREGLAKIHDIVLDVQCNRVNFVILSTGGILGFGSKELAVPWGAFSFSGDGKALILNADKRKIKDAPKLDKKRWSDLSDPQWISRVDEYWGVKERPAKMEKHEHAALTAPSGLWGRRVSQLTGLDVRDLDGQSLGALHDLVIDTREGRVAYSIVALGGTMGVGEKWVAVPWGAIELVPDLQSARLSADRKTLDILAFSPDQFPDLTNRSYASSLSERFNLAPNWNIFGYAPPREVPPSAAAWQPGSGYNRKFDPAKLETIRGVVESVDSFEPESGAAPGLKLRVRMEDGHICTIECGPMSFARDQRAEFNFGDAIYVTGSKVGLGWLGTTLMASEIRKGDQVFTLRGSDGRPMWDPEKIRDERPMH